MTQIKFDFIETPEKTLDAADYLMPQLSTLSEEDLQKLKGGYVPCDAVCLPPGYGPCNCYSNLAIAQHSPYCLLMIPGDGPTRTAHAEMGETITGALF